MQSLVIVCYDICDPRRLRQIAELMEGWGVRVQYSIFRCHLDEKSREQLRWKLLQLMEPEDSVLFIPVCAACSCRVANLGAQPPWESTPPKLTIL
jgi:CRISPR-associated protein Cas2